jgi:hypothetical protein
VYNRFILDIGIADYGGGEIAEGKWHIGAVRAIVAERSALLVFDRNYVSLDFIDCLECAGAKVPDAAAWITRLKSGSWREKTRKWR